MAFRPKDDSYICGPRWTPAKTLWFWNGKRTEPKPKWDHRFPALDDKAFWKASRGRFAKTAKYSPASGIGIASSGVPDSFGWRARELLRFTIIFGRSRL